MSSESLVTKPRTISIPVYALSDEQITQLIRTLTETMDELGREGVIGMDEAVKTQDTVEQLQAELEDRKGRVFHAG